MPAHGAEGKRRQEPGGIVDGHGQSGAAGLPVAIRRGDRGGGGLEVR
jgi:hypothetical protein